MMPKAIDQWRQRIMDAPPEARAKLIVEGEQRAQEDKEALEEALGKHADQFWRWATPWLGIPAPQSKAVFRITEDVSGKQRCRRGMWVAGLVETSIAAWILEDRLRGLGMPGLGLIIGTFGALASTVISHVALGSLHRIDERPDVEPFPRARLRAVIRGICGSAAGFAAAFVVSVIARSVSTPILPPSLLAGLFDVGLVGGTLSLIVLAAYCSLGGELYGRSIELANVHERDTNLLDLHQRFLKELGALK